MEKFYNEIYGINKENIPLEKHDYQKACNFTYKYFIDNRKMASNFIAYIEEFKDVNLTKSQFQEIKIICQKEPVRNAFMIGKNYIEAYQQFKELSEKIEYKKKVIFQVYALEENINNKKKIFEIKDNKDLLKELDISSLKMTNRTTNALKRAHIISVYDLLNCTHKDLSLMKNIGELSVKEIEYILLKNNLRLKNANVESA